MKRLLLVLAFGLSACGVQSPEQRLLRLEQASIYDLWPAQRITQNVNELRVVEYELVRRGEARFGTSYIGQRSATTLNRSIFDRTNIGGSDTLNCSDFPNAISAQRKFIRSGGPTLDPHRLDADGDGFACEWGTEIRRISRQARPSPVVPPRRYTPTCHRGPRGGTYAITSSGGRDYSGC